jgi:hypothetical protein
VGELAQLRRREVAPESDHWTIRLTSEAGKHQVVKVAADGDVLGPLRGLKNRLAEFARVLVTDPNVAPMHGWRHRFKTVGMAAGIATRILASVSFLTARL